MEFGTPRPVFDDLKLKYNPTGEWIFPSVVDASVLSSAAPARWHLYYSPHDGPGGICLAYADNLLGPWVEYDRNPIISNEWAPHYRVSHVASPHALWIEEEGKLFLWFHGENDVTHYASSADGIHFDYEGAAVSTADFDNSTECSYGRVFRHRLPSRDSRYVILLMGSVEGRCVIHLGWSPDARSWSTLRRPLIVVPEALGGHGASAWLYRDEDGPKLVYHSGRGLPVGFRGDPRIFDLLGDFCVVRVSEDLEPRGGHQVLHRAREGYPDFGRVCDFALVHDDRGEAVVFYVAGKRLQGRLFFMPARAGEAELVKPPG